MTETKRRASTAAVSLRGGSSSSRPVTNADKFTLLFDKDWRNTKSRIRTKVDDDRSYDISNSWDARSDNCLLYTSPSPRDRTRSRMPSSA